MSDYPRECGACGTGIPGDQEWCERCLDASPRATEPGYRRPVATHCEAAHPEDTRDCVGNVDAVLITDNTHSMTFGCVLHGAVALKSLVDARVEPGTEDGAAIAAYELAKELPPFAWRGRLAVERAAELRNRYVADAKDKGES